MAPGNINRSKRTTRIKQRECKAVDLFSGCGGLTEGLKQAGFTVVGAVECDSLAVETYKVNHKSVEVIAEEIQKIDPAEFLETLGLKPGELDLLAGCPPCQGFSSMTTLNGKLPKNDERNDLVFEFLRFVKEFRPRTIMMENVPGLATDGRLAKIRDEFHALGYKTTVAVLNAADFGVPQRRKRMILLGGMGKAIRFGRKAFVQKTVADAFALLKETDPTKDELQTVKEDRSTRIQTLIKAIPKDGGSRKDLGPEHQLPCHQKSDGFKDVYGRMAWKKVSPTITGGCCNPSKGRFLHPQEDRTISLREAALLQSFPPSYHFSMRRGKSAVAQMIGNALPPEFIRRQALSVFRFLVASHS
jgi:DNA (cytosine-5)-methyltransferase 1